jgi:hypothetical protein
MDDLKQALRDFVATSNSGKYSDFNTLMSKFPELSGIDSNALKDFVATSNSGKYKSEDELFGKFPEFSFSKKKEESALPLGQGSTLSATPGTEPQKPSAFFVKGKIKTPSTFNKNVEDSDFKRHQDLYRSAKKSIDSGDRQAFLQSKKKLDDLRKSYGDVMANDSNLSEDYNLLNSLSEEKFKQEKKKELRFIQEEERVPVQQTQKKQLEKSIKGYESDVKYTPEERVTMLEIQRDLLELVDYDGISKEVSDEYSAYSMKPIYTKIGMLSVPQVEGSANDAIKMAVDELVAAGKEPNKDAVLERASEIRTEEVKNKREYEAIDDKYKFSSILGKSEDQKEKEQALQGIKKKRESHAEMFKSKVGQLEALESQIKQYEDIAKEQGQLSDVERSEALDVFNRYKRLSTDIVKNYSNIENDTENIGDFDTELDAFKRNHTYLTSASVKSLAMLEGIGAGVVEGAGMVNNIAYDLTGNAEFYLRANDLLGIGKSIQDSAQGMLDGVSKSKQLEDIKDAGDAIEWAGALMVENTPQILINVLTNGQAIPFLAASSAGEKYMEVYGDESYTDLQKYAASILVGGGTAISEKLELAAFSKLWPSKRLAKAAIESSGREAFEKSLSDGVRKGISDVFSRSKNALAGVNQEGVSEIADQLSRNLVDKYVLDKEDVSITDGLGEAYLSGAVVGAGLGAAPHVFSSIVRPFVNDPNRDIIKNVNKIQKLSESLEKADEKMKPIIQERIGQLRGRNEAIIQKAVNSFDSLTPSEVKEAVNIYEDITSLKKEYGDIKEDTTIPPDVKEALLESVFTKYNSLVERRLQILKKAEENAVQEQTTSEVPVQPEAAVGEEVAQGATQAEPEVVTEESIPQEITSLKDDESVLVTVKTIDEVPQQFRDRARESSKTEIKTKKSFFGIPYGPTQKTEVGGGFTYTITGLEAKELATQELQKNAKPEVVTEEGKAEIVIDKPTISKNSKVEVDKVVSATIETETGQTFNIDGTVYSDGGLVVPVVSENLKQEELTPERIADFVEKNKGKIGSNTVKVGIYKFPNKKEVSIDLNIVVPRNNREAALQFGKIAGQESLFDLDTFENIKTGLDGKFPKDFTDEEFRKISKDLEEGRVPETGQQQKVAAEQGTPTTIEGTGLRENIKKSIAKVFKKFEVKSFKNAKEMAAYAKATYNQETGATDAARVFAGEQGVEILVNEELADDTALGHEVWHALLLKAFGDNQKQFAAFRGAINKTLRENGYEDIADSLDEFTSEYTAEDEVPAEEYLAQLGGLMTSANIDLKNLTPAQKTLLEQIKDIINEFAIKLTGQPVFLKDATAETILDFMSTMSEMMAKGEDISGFFGEANKATGVKTRAQIDPRLSELGVDVNKKEKLPQKITPANESKVLAQVDNLLNTYPKALTDNNQWKELMSRVFSYKGPNGEVMIPKFPTGLSRMSSSVSEVLKELSKVSEKQRDLASSGLKGTKEIGKLYKEGKMDETDTGLYFLWNIMSIGISPYPQEAGFLRAVNNGIDSFIKKSADGKFLTGKEIDYNGEKIDSGLAEYFKWVDETLPKGVAGSGSKANLRSFGSAFLSKASTKIESGEFSGLTKMQALHEILSDKTTPTNELRRKWLANLSGMSFNNKIFDFILLTTGRSDLFVIDRVRTEHFWDSDNLKKESGLKPATSIYDGSELIFGKTQGAGYSKMLSDVSGMVFAELANRTMQPVVQEAYSKIGVTNSPDVGRFHWETWVAASSQEVSHGSIDAIVQRKKSGEITDAGIRQGKYGAWDFNFAYKKRSGKDFVYEFVDEEGNTYVFDDISEIYEEISNQNTKKGYKDNSERFILKDEKGNIIKRKTEKIDNAWYDQYGVNKQKYFEYLKGKAKEFIPAPNVIEDQGVIIVKEPEVKTRAQKAVPDVVDEVLTDDGKGNYLFVHYSDERRKTIKPMSGSNKGFTSREEVAAISSVGGVAMYYTKRGQTEQGVGDVPHTVLVPKDKVYFYGTTERGKVSHDVDNFEPEARRRFQEYKNRNNPGKPTEFAFDSDNSAAWVGKVAEENGYDMLVTNWGDPKSYRAQSVKELTPEADYTAFKEIPEPVFEVGDEVFLYGRYSIITDVDPKVLTYKTENAFGSFDTGKFPNPMNVMTRNKIIMIKKAKPSTTTRAQKANPKTIPGYDRMISQVNGIITKSNNRGLDKIKTTENVLNYIQKSAVYERADDLQREQIIRDARKELGLSQKSAPSVERLFGIKDKVSTEDKKNLMEVIKAQIRATKNLVKVQKDIQKQINKEIRELKDKGKITTSQMIAALRRLTEVDLLNEESVSNFLDYVGRVFKDAAYYERVTNINRKRRAARISATTKIGIANGLTPLLQKIFSIDARTIPEKVLNAYEELVNMFADRSRVLQLSDIEIVTKMAKDVFEAVEGEVERAMSLAEVLSNYDNILTDDNGNIEYSKTIDQMVNDGSISAEDGELMKKYKSMILEEAGLKKEKDVRSEEEIEEERQQLVETVKAYKPVFFQLPTQDERNVAREIFRLIQTGAIDKMSNKDLKDLLRIIDNIERGFLPHSAQIMKERMNQINNGETLSEAVNKAKMLPIESRYVKIKAMFGGSAIRKAIDRNPLFFIDELFGNFNTKPIFESIFQPISRAFAGYQSEINTINRKIQNAMDDMSNSLGKNPNKVQFAKQKIMAYMLESEYQANPNSKEVRTAKDFLDATIKYAEETEQNSYSDKDVENLKKIRDKFFSGESVDLDAMLESFSPAEKKAIKTIADINNELSTKVAFTSAIIRGRKVGSLNSYIHHNTLGEKSAADMATNVSMADVFNASMKPSTKAKSLIERTGAATPLVFDPFSSTTRGARQLLMDYHLTEPIRTARRSFKYAESKVEGKQKKILNAISGALEQALSNTLINTYHETTFVEDAIRYIEQTGYRAMLGSIPRAASELISNLHYVMIYDPKSFISGVSTYRSVAMSETGLNVMKNARSQQIERLYPASKLSGRGLDKEVMSQASGIKAGKSQNDVMNAMTVIYNYSAKQLKNTAEATSDALIGSPDKAIMKPLWFGAFASEFKKEAGQDVDYDKIANNNEAYLTEFKDAIDKASQHADETSVRVGASDNPFTGILKGANAANQSAMKQAFNKFNNFMSRFLIYEYTTARTGVYALMGDGKLTQKQGAAILGATMSRMIVYSLLSKELVNIMMEMLGFGDDEEDEKTFLQKLGQSTASAFSGLILGRNFGNFTKAPINIGVEEVNKEFLDFLRDGDYDPYEDAIQYTIIPKDERKKGDIMEYVKSFSGAFSPMIGTAQRTLQVAMKDLKTGEAQERRLKELSTRTPLEILGNTGYVPLYRDVRKIVMESLYEDMKKEGKGSGGGGIKTTISTKIK